MYKHTRRVVVPPGLLGCYVVGRAQRQRQPVSSSHERLRGHNVDELDPSLARAAGDS